MKHHIVADGMRRVLKSDHFQERQRALLAAVRAKYAEPLAKAGWLEKLQIRDQIRREYNLELKKTKPSPGSLFLHSGFVASLAEKAQPATRVLRPPRPGLPLNGTSFNKQPENP